MAKSDPEVNLNADPDTPAYKERAVEVCSCHFITMDHIC